VGLVNRFLESHLSVVTDHLYRILFSHFFHFELCYSAWFRSQLVFGRNNFKPLHGQWSDSL